MAPGEAAYAPEWRMGYQEALLAPASGMWVGDREMVFEKIMTAGHHSGQDL